MVKRRQAGDPYEILGVARGADAREVRTAYRRLAKQYHPDVNPSHDAAEMMARINWAYGAAMEHARREGGARAYRGATHAERPRTGRVRWYVRQRPPPQGGKLTVITRSISLRGQRGENANVEGLLVVENRGTGPLEGEARGQPAHVIVSPKQFELAPNGTQMFRVSVPNQFCGSETTEASVLLESNGGDDRVTLHVPPAAEVLVSLEPSTVDFGQVTPGEQVQARLRVNYRGRTLPRISVETSAAWLRVAPLSLPRRTQYFRLTAEAPHELGEATATATATAGGAVATTTVRMVVVQSQQSTDRPPADARQDAVGE